MPRQVKDGALPEGVHDMRILSTKCVRETKPNYKRPTEIDVKSFVRVVAGTKLGDTVYREEVKLGLDEKSRHWTAMDLQALGFDVAARPITELNANPLKGNSIKITVYAKVLKEGEDPVRLTEICHEEEIVDLDDLARDFQQFAQSMALRAGEGAEDQAEPVKTFEILPKDLEEKSGLDFVDPDEEDDAA